MANNYQISSVVTYDNVTGNIVNQNDASNNLGGTQIDDGFWDVGDRAFDGINSLTFAGSYVSGVNLFLVFDDTNFNSTIIYSVSTASSDPGYPTDLSTLPTLTTTQLMTCFAEGTLISTPGGAERVETLTPGEHILTPDGSVTEITWIGRQTVHRRVAGAHMQPVRIRKGALGGGLPYSDLTVTADHGMVFFASSSEAVGDTQTGYVINASALVNGHSIDFVPMAELEETFTVYHIETEHHDVILANGAPSETFVDAVTRSHFDNYQEYLDLYGAERIIPEIAMPRIASARLVPQAIKARLRIGTRLISQNAAGARRAG